jgi:peroxiredoxin
MENSKSTVSLKTLLDAKRADFAAKAPDSKKKLYAEGIQAVADSGILESAVNVGDRAPHFSLTNATGNTVSLADELKKGPVVLTWYRGGWCPYCNITLRSLQNELSYFKAKGASLIALTPELPDKSLTTAEKNDLNFEVLSDVGNVVAKEYGIVFELIEGVADSYNKAFNLPEYNGDDSNQLPLAASYVINTDGTIVYAFLDADYRNRAEPSDIKKALQSIT